MRGEGNLSVVECLVENGAEVSSTDKGKVSCKVLILNNSSGLLLGILVVHLHLG